MRWRLILTRTFQETLRDDAEGLAAQLSYYFFLSLFPMLLALVALASLFPLQNFTDDVQRFLGPFVPHQALQLIQEQMRRIGDQKDTGLLSLGLASAVWSSSAAMGAIVSAMNRAYGIVDKRPWWKVKLIAIGLTLGLAVFILFSLTLVLAGPEVADILTRWFGLARVFAWIWKVLQWPLVFALVSFGIAMIYHFAPNRSQRWIWLTVGSVLATTLWLVFSLAFRLYVTRFGTFEGTYGTIGGIIVLLLWLYVSGLAIVIGAELDSEIEREIGERAAVATVAAKTQEAAPASAPPSSHAK